jgi:hypothetical protein
MSGANSNALGAHGLGRRTSQAISRMLPVLTTVKIQSA